MTTATLGAILIVLGIVVLAAALALPLVYGMRQRSVLAHARAAAERASA